MTNLLSLVALLLALLLCWREPQKIRSRALVLVVAAIFFGLSALGNGCAPYYAAAGLAIAASSFLKQVPDRVSHLCRRIGGTLATGGLMAVMAGLFQSPSQDTRDMEDRSDWQPPPVVELSPDEKLKLKWSTYDKYANWPVADLMLELSDVAYDSPADARPMIKQKYGWDSESINAGAMQGYVIDAGNDAIITLRGTERHEYDILQDLRFLKSTTKEGSMHGGFVSGYDPMHDQVLKLLKQYDTKRVWLTGHSLGGGLAVVCAHRLIVDGQYEIAGMMTFGQPKVVRSDMAAYLAPKLAGKYAFFVCDMDPVTRLISPYEHFGHMVRWNDTDIERSRIPVTTSASQSEADAGKAAQEAGYIEGMSNIELAELIEKSEEAQKPKYDDKGNLLMQGFVPNIYDHFLSSYRNMLETLRTHSTKK